MHKAVAGPKLVFVGNRMANTPIEKYSTGLGYVEATRKAQDRNYWLKSIASDPAMDGN